MILMNTAATRLVNCTTLVRITTDTGRTYLQLQGGADGIPERALDIARIWAGYNSPRLEVLGIGITDVITREQWAVAL
jgi:hypothetical protein